MKSKLGEVPIMKSPLAYSSYLLCVHAAKPYCSLLHFRIFQKENCSQVADLSSHQNFTTKDWLSTNKIYVFKVDGGLGINFFKHNSPSLFMKDLGNLFNKLGPKGGFKDAAVVAQHHGHIKRHVNVRLLGLHILTQHIDTIKI